MHAGIANEPFPLKSVRWNVPGIPGACTTRIFTYLLHFAWNCVLFHSEFAYTLMSNADKTEAIYRSVLYSPPVNITEPSCLRVLVSTQPYTSLQILAVGQYNTTLLRGPWLADMTWPWTQVLFPWQQRPSGRYRFDIDPTLSRRIDVKSMSIQGLCYLASTLFITLYYSLWCLVPRINHLLSVC